MSIKNFIGYFILILSIIYVEATTDIEFVSLDGTIITTTTPAPPVTTIASETEGSSQPCLDYISVNIDNGTKLENGSIIFDNILFPPEIQYVKNNQLRGCPCKVKTCFRYCCRPNEYYEYRRKAGGPGCKKRQNITDDYITPIDLKFMLDPAIVSIEENFYTLFSNLCLSKIVPFFPSNESTDLEKYTILKDGTLTIRHRTEQKFTKYETFKLDHERYCVSSVQDPNKLIILGCHSIEEIDEMARDKAVRWTQSIAAIISVIFLILTLLVYGLFSSLRNLHGKVLMCYIACLATALSFLFIIRHEESQQGLPLEACKSISYIVHFSFLASFFWLNVMCFDIWWTFGGFRSLHGSVKQRERKKFIMYSIYAWSCSSILTIVCMIMDLAPGIPEGAIRPGFGKGSCWFSNTWARALYFYGPMGLTVLCNICLFILTAVKILRHKKDTARQLKGSESRRHDDNKQWFNLYLKLFIVMGINWSMEIISWLFADTLPKYVWYLTDLTNTLQGVIIFIIFVWKDKIKRLLLKRFGCQGNNFLSRNSTSRSGPTSSASRTTCVTAAPLQEKVNPYADSYRPKNNTTVTDESDCI